MKRTIFINGLLGLILLFFTTPAWGLDLNELSRRFDMLADEFDVLKQSGKAEPDRVSIHGYGELHYNMPNSGADEIDFHRMVWGVHARLADWIHVESEIDFEHGAQELELEFAHVNFLLNPKYNVRAGKVLVPMGFLNEFHEPPLFWSVERPELQKVVIPTTWGAAGAGLFGTLVEGLNYRLYVVNSLQSIRETGFGSGGGTGGGGDSGRFRARDGVRAGRLEINEAIAENFAVTGRLEYNKLYPGLELGFSFYTGETSQDIISEGGRTTFLEGDIQFRKQWFEANATVVNVDISDARALNIFRVMEGNTSDGVIPDNIFGWNIQGGIHVLQLANVNTTHDVIPFVLYENIDLHDSVPGGFAADPALDMEIITVGVSYLPIPEVALKLDYQNWDFADGTSKSQVNMGVAYMF